MIYRYVLEVEVETDDYVETLGEINDIIQDNLSGSPDIIAVRIIKQRFSA